MAAVDAGQRDRGREAGRGGGKEGGLCTSLAEIPDVTVLKWW